jgi:hypothetical protein
LFFNFKDFNFLDSEECCTYEENLSAYPCVAYMGIPKPTNSI